MKIERGDLLLTDLTPVKGSEQGGVRPTVVVQNDVGNQYSPTTIVAPLTTSYNDIYPTDVEVLEAETPVDKDSKILLNQITTVSIEGRIREKLGSFGQETMDAVDDAIKVSLALD